jgi:hypothetical protein
LLLLFCVAMLAACAPVDEPAAVTVPGGEAPGGEAPGTAPGAESREAGMGEAEPEASGTQKGFTAAELAAAVLADIDMSKWQEADEKTLRRYYDLDDVVVEDFVFYLAATNIEADEFAVFVVPDTEAKDKLTAEIQRRLERQKSNFEDYLPAQEFLLENPLIMSRPREDKSGYYVVFAVSAQTERIEDAFAAAFEANK